MSVGDDESFTRGNIQNPGDPELFADICQMIEETRASVAATVNAGLTILYWRVGKRIREEILGHDRAEYGKQIVATLSRQLEANYGKGFSEKSLRHMLRFAEVFPDERIVSALMRHLSWTGQASMWPNTSRPCRPKKSCSRSSIPQSSCPTNGWKIWRCRHDGSQTLSRNEGLRRRVAVGGNRGVAV